MSEDYYIYWGKADKEGNYHLLVYHSLDVAAVGEVMFRGNPKLLNRFAKLLNLDEILFKNLFLFFLSIHDLGKFADSFQGQIESIYLKLNPESKPKTYNIRHDSLGYILWLNVFLINRRGNLNGCLVSSNYFELQSPNQNRNIKDLLNWLICITTGHHGKPPSNTGYTNNPIDLYSHYTQKNISDSWEFLDKVYHLFLSKDQIDGLSKIDYGKVVESIKNNSFWLAGLSVLCDWIGSNKEIFTYESEQIPLEKYWKDYAIPRAEKAIEKAGVLPSKISKYATPQELFFNPADSKPFVPTPLQKACDSITLTDQPQLIILEDVTGAGKTEASFILAKRLMEITNYDGVFIGLPTMATANGMYSRTAKIYKKFYDPNSKPSLILAHGAKGLSKEFRDTIISDSMIEDFPNGKDEGSATANCLEWLSDSSKKATLADVAVGTIDQVLISILLSKFQSLRMFGMMNKILILDEVHAYDSYMNELIIKLLKAQAKIGASVLLLSATLPNELKNKLISAYQTVTIEKQKEENLPYPLITQKVLNQTPILIPVNTREEVKRTVKVELIDDENEIYSLIEKSVIDNKCVCWIRNTVTDAMSSYEELSSNPNYKKDNIILFHARFAMGDRLDKEQEVLKLFGKESNAEDRRGKIVIATQVVEQSLDLDFDVMISDLAPIDLVIQRAGRLHRHTRDKDGNRIQTKDGREKPILFVNSPALQDNPEGNWYSSFFPGGAKVYPDHGKLYLSAKVLNSKGEIKMPEEARNLIEFVYGSREHIPQNLLEVSKQNENLNNQKASQAQNNTIKIAEGYKAAGNETIWTDITAPTRLGDETVKVILAKWENNQLVPWYDQGDFPWANSEVKVMSYILKSEQVVNDNILKKAIKFCKEKLPDKGKYSVLIPLSRLSNDNWVGSALDNQGNEVQCMYDLNIGFRKIK